MAPIKLAIWHNQVGARNYMYIANCAGDLCYETFDPDLALALLEPLDLVKANAISAPTASITMLSTAPQAKDHTWTETLPRGA